MDEIFLIQALAKLLVLAVIVALVLSLIEVLIEFYERKLICDKKFDEFRLKLFKNYRLSIPESEGYTEICCLNRGKVNLTLLSGENLFCQAIWLGFITREECVRLSGRYVWFEATHIDRSRKTRSKEKGRALKRGEYVQGWQTQNGVYAVTDNMVAVIGAFAD